MSDMPSAVPLARRRDAAPAAKDDGPGLELDLVELKLTGNTPSKVVDITKEDEQRTRDYTRMEKHERHASLPNDASSKHPHSDVGARREDDDGLELDRVEVNPEAIRLGLASRKSLASAKDNKKETLAQGTSQLFGAKTDRVQSRRKPSPRMRLASPPVTPPPPPAAAAAAAGTPPQAPAPPPLSQAADAIMPKTSAPSAPFGIAYEPLSRPASAAKSEQGYFVPRKAEFEDEIAFSRELEDADDDASSTSDSSEFDFDADDVADNVGNVNKAHSQKKDTDRRPNLAVSSLQARRGFALQGSKEEAHSQSSAQQKATASKDNDQRGKSNSVESLEQACLVFSKLVKTDAVLDDDLSPPAMTKTKPLAAFLCVDRRGKLETLVEEEEEEEEEEDEDVDVDEGNNVSNLKEKSDKIHDPKVSKIVDSKNLNTTCKKSAHHEKKVLAEPKRVMSKPRMKHPERRILIEVPPFSPPDELNTAAKQAENASDSMLEQNGCEDEDVWDSLARSHPSQAQPMRFIANDLIRAALTYDDGHSAQPREGEGNDSEDRELGPGKEQGITMDSKKTRKFMSRLGALRPSRGSSSQWTDLDDLERLAKTALDWSRHEDQCIMEALYQRLAKGEQHGFPDNATPSSKWESIGFQGIDPSTDLRGCGLLGPIQMVALGEEEPDLVRNALALSREGKREFPFMAVSLNFTIATLQVLRRHANDRRIGSSAREAGVLLFKAFWKAMVQRWSDQKMILANFSPLLAEFRDAAMKKPVRFMQQYSASKKL